MRRTAAAIILALAVLLPHAATAEPPLPLRVDVDVETGYPSAQGLGAGIAITNTAPEDVGYLITSAGGDWLGDGTLTFGSTAAVAVPAAGYVVHFYTDDGDDRTVVLVRSGHLTRLTLSLCDQP